MAHWWRSRFSRLGFNEFKLELSEVFDFASSIEIEEERDHRLNRLRANLLEDLAMASAAAEVAGSQAQERARCPSCGTVLQGRGKPLRQLTSQGDHQLHLKRSYGSCPSCQVGFFPSG